MRIHKFCGTAHCDFLIPGLAVLAIVLCQHTETGARFSWLWLPVTVSVARCPSHFQAIAESTGTLALVDRVVDGNFRFSGWNAEGQFVFQTSDDQRLQIDEGQLAWWSGHQTNPAQSLIRMADNSIFAGHVGSLDLDQLQVSSSIWQSTGLPRKSVKGVLFHLAVDPGGQDRWMDRLEEARDADRAWMIDGDFIEGTVVEIADNRKLVLKTGDRSIRIPVDRIAAITFRQADANERSEAAVEGKAEATFEYSFTDGSRLRVSEIQFVDNQIHATLAATDLKLKSKVSTIDYPSTFQLVTGIRNLRLDSVYLSHLKPLDYKHQPLTGHQTQYQMNRCVAGTGMRHERTTYPFGIGMPSRSSLVFRLEEPAEALQFGLAIDESSGGQGSVVCGILILDDKNLWRKVWSSAVVRGADPVVFETVPVSNARAIALTVDYADRADVMDRVNWLMPRLVR